MLAQLNDEDEEAIQRLMALGFPRPIVIQGARFRMHPALLALLMH